MIDLARRTHATGMLAAPSSRLHEQVLGVQLEGDELCVAVPPLAAAPPAYGIVEIATGSSVAPLRAHVYDRGPQGLWLAGIERD